MISLCVHFRVLQREENCASYYMRRETRVDGLSNDSEMFDNGKDDCSNWRKETPIEMSCSDEM